MRLSHVRKAALALPEVTEEPHFHRTSFRVRGKIFATAAVDEPFVNVMVGESAREPVLAMHPDFVEKLMWGNKVVGIRIDLRKANHGVTIDLLRQAWREKAPKSILEDSAAVSSR